MATFSIIITNASDETVTFDDSTNATRGISGTRECTLAENRPWTATFELWNKTTVPAKNILSDDYAGWTAGTGPIEIGQRVEYKVVPTSTGTITRVLFGFITKIRRKPSGNVLVSVANDMQLLESSKSNRVVFGSYRDSNISALTFNAGVPGLACPDATINLPPVAAKVATKNEIQAIGRAPMTASSATPATDTGTQLNAAGRKVAQAIDFHDLIGWVRIHIYAGAANTASLKYSIQSDSGGYPSGTAIGKLYKTTPGGSAATWATFVFTPTDADYGYWLEKAGRYWLVFETAGDTTVVDLKVGVENDVNSLSNYNDYVNYDGTWHSNADKNIIAAIYYGDFSEMPLTDCYYSGGYLYMPSSNGGYSLAGGIGDIGRLSYYYGTTTLQSIFNGILWRVATDNSITYSISADYERTFPLYRMRGNTVADCVRELGNVFETSGTYDGYQHVLAHYEDAGTHYLKGGFRKKVGNAPSFIFSHGADTANDSEHRIIKVDLQKRTEDRPASVIVIGRSTRGEPICAQRDDRALGASSFRTKSRCALTYTCRDDDVRTDTDANTRAYRILDSIARDTWEGTVIIRGVFPDLFDLDDTSATFGSGNIITLNYSPMGIIDTDFKVKGITLKSNTTEIQISNADTVVENWIADAANKTDKIEGFSIPNEPTGTYFVSVYSTVAFNDSDGCICLADGGSIPVGPKVVATKFQNAAYNLNTYHAVLREIDGSTTAVHVQLYDNPVVFMVDEVGEWVPKYRTSRVIIDWNCPIA